MYIGSLNLVPRAFPLKVEGTSYLQGKSPGNEVVGSLYLISIDFYDFYFDVFSLGLVLIKNIFRAREAVFDHIFKCAPQSS